MTVNSGCCCCYFLFDHWTVKRFVQYPIFAQSQSGRRSGDKYTVNNSHRSRLCKNVSLAVLFGNNGNSYIVSKKSNMYVCVCIYIYIYIYILFIYAHTHIIYIYIYTYIRARAHARTHTPTPTHSPPPRTHTHSSQYRDAGWAKEVKRKAGNVLYVKCNIEARSCNCCCSGKALLLLF